MKSRLSLIFAALVILLGAMVWVVRDRAPVTVPQAVAMPLRSESPIETQAVEIFAGPLSTPPTAPLPAPLTIVAEHRNETPAALVQPVGKGLVRINEAGDPTYVAQAGDTLSQLAIALLGSDSKPNRDAVVAANSSLASAPDLVLTGQTYKLHRSSVSNSDDSRTGATASASVEPTGSKAVVPAVSKLAPETSDAVVAGPSGPTMLYQALPGDTVRVLAARLLGGDTKANRDTIIDHNPSLQQDPDQLEAGVSYTIVPTNGLAAAPNAPQASTPMNQPDADDVTRQSSSRTLRYTALAGDSVAKLALVLLGGDTAANRELVIKSNPTLKADPSNLQAGRVYWIEAPVSEVR